MAYHTGIVSASSIVPVGTVQEALVVVVKIVDSRYVLALLTGC